MDSLLTYLGCTPEWSWSYPDAATLKNNLRNTVKSDYFDQFQPAWDSVLNTWLKDNTLDYMNYVQPKMWIPMIWAITEF